MEAQAFPPCAPPSGLSYMPRKSACGTARARRARASDFTSLTAGPISVTVQPIKERILKRSSLNLCASLRHG